MKLFNFKYVFILNVPFNEKEEVKKYKARWNKDGKNWYIQLDELGFKENREYLEFSKYWKVEAINALSLTDKNINDLLNKCKNIYDNYQNKKELIYLNEFKQIINNWRQNAKTYFYKEYLNPIFNDRIYKLQKISNEKYEYMRRYYNNYDDIRNYYNKKVQFQAIKKYLKDNNIYIYNLTTNIKQDNNGYFHELYINNIKIDNNIIFNDKE